MLETGNTFSCSVDYVENLYKTIYSVWKLEQSCISQTVCLAKYIVKAVLFND